MAALLSLAGKLENIQKQNHFSVRRAFFFFKCQAPEKLTRISSNVKGKASPRDKKKIGGTNSLGPEKMAS